MRIFLSSLFLTVTFAPFAQAMELNQINNLVSEKLATSVVSTQEQPKNFMISGTSMQQALSILANGTANQTKTQLENVLGSEVSTQNEVTEFLTEKLNFTQKQKEEMQSQSRHAYPAVISTQNSLWNTNGNTDGAKFKFDEAFKSAAMQYYSAEAYELDFKDKATTEKVNQWASDKTNGLIKEILKYDEVKDLLWIIMNATYLEASWATPFYSLNAASPRFQLLDGSSVDASMMKSEQYTNFMRLKDGSEMVSIRLRSDQPGTDLAFVVHLPEESLDFQESQMKFFTEDLKNFTLPMQIAASSVELTKITMPKFNFATSVKMEFEGEVTKKMGLNFLFEDRADFSAMEAPGSFTSKVGFIKQDSKIEVDEKGIKAAAVTVIGGVRTTSVRPEPSAEIVLDRPFSFAIVDRNTQAVLFTGSMVNPTKQ